jgi:hypothetical protein
VRTFLKAHLPVTAARQYASRHNFAKEKLAKENLMDHRHTAALTGASLLFLGLALSTGGVVGQPAEQKMHRSLAA